MRTVRPWPRVLKNRHRQPLARKGVDGSFGFDDVTFSLSSLTSLQRVVPAIEVPLRIWIQLQGHKLQLFFTAGATYIAFEKGSINFGEGVDVEVKVKKLECAPRYKTYMAPILRRLRCVQDHLSPFTNNPKQSADIRPRSLLGPHSLDSRLSLAQGVEIAR